MALWLPDGELDWDLLSASRTEASGWQQAWRIPARTPDGQVVFVVMRESNDHHGTFSASPGERLVRGQFAVPSDRKCPIRAVAEMRHNRL